MAEQDKDQSLWRKIRDLNVGDVSLGDVAKTGIDIGGSIVKSIAPTVEKPISGLMDPWNITGMSPGLTGLPDSPVNIKDLAWNAFSPEQKYAGNAAASKIIGGDLISPTADEPYTQQVARNLPLKAGWALNDLADKVAGAEAKHDYMAPGASVPTFSRDWFKKFAHETLSLAGWLGGEAAASAAHPSLGVAYFYSTASGDIYDSAIQKGADPKDAARVAQAGGLLSVMIWGKPWLGKLAGKVAASHPSRMGFNALLRGAAEPIDITAKNLVNSWADTVISKINAIPGTDWMEIRDSIERIPSSLMTSILFAGKRMHGGMKADRMQMKAAAEKSAADFEAGYQERKRIREDKTIPVSQKKQAADADIARKLAPTLEYLDAVCGKTTKAMGLDPNGPAAAALHESLTKPISDAVEIIKKDYTELQRPGSPLQRKIEHQAPKTEPVQGVFNPSSKTTGISPRLRLVKINMFTEGLPEFLVWQSPTVKAIFRRRHNADPNDIIVSQNMADDVMTAIQANPALKDKVSTELKAIKNKIAELPEFDKDLALNSGAIPEVDFHSAKDLAPVPSLAARRQEPPSTTLPAAAPPPRSGREPFDINKVKPDTIKIAKGILATIAKTGKTGAKQKAWLDKHPELIAYLKGETTEKKTKKFPRK